MRTRMFVCRAKVGRCLRVGGLALLLSGLAVDRAAAQTPAFVLVSARETARILKLDVDGSYLGVFAEGTYGGTLLTNTVGMALSPDGNVYVALGAEGNPILKFDRSGNYLGNAYDNAEGYRIDRLTFGPDGRLYFSCPFGNSPTPTDQIVRVDGLSSVSPVITSYSTADNPRGLSFGPHDGYLYVAARNLDRIDQYLGPYHDTPWAVAKAGWITNNVPIGHGFTRPQGLRWRGERLYVGYYTSGTISSLGVYTNAVREKVLTSGLNGAALGVDVTPDRDVFHTQFYNAGVNFNRLYPFNTYGTDQGASLDGYPMDVLFVPSPSADDDYMAAVTADSPVVYWRFDDPGSTPGMMAMNRIGSQAFNGVYEGGVTLVKDTAPGLAGTSARFNGTDGRLRLPSFQVRYAMYDAPAFTVEAWIKPDTLPSVDNRSVIFSSRIWDTRAGFSLNLLNDGGTNAIQLAGRSEKDDDFRSARFEVDIPITEWTHLVGMLDFDGDEIRLYVNGKPLTPYDTLNANSWTETTYGPRVVVSGSEVDAVGADSNYGLSCYFHGCIDEVAVYTNVLSAERIRAHYRAGCPPRGTVLMVR
jgi:hypothetical protein